LLGADWFPGADRFLYFGVGADAGGEELFKSQQKKNVLDPAWNEECELPAGRSLKFTVFKQMQREDGRHRLCKLRLG